MFAVRAINLPLALLTLVSLFLTPILATDPRDISASTSSHERHAREALPRLGETDAPAIQASRRRLFFSDPDHTAPGTASRRADRITPDLLGLPDTESQDQTTPQPRGAGAPGSPPPRRVDLKHERSAPVATSAAPKVFGVNIYLIIAWLVLMYLMYRTGSMF